MGSRSKVETILIWVRSSSSSGVVLGVAVVLSNHLLEFVATFDVRVLWDLEVFVWALVEVVVVVVLANHLLEYVATFDARVLLDLKLKVVALVLVVVV